MQASAGRGGRRGAWEFAAPQAETRCAAPPPALALCSKLCLAPGLLPGPFPLKPFCVCRVPAAIPSLLVGRSEQCSKQSATVVLASLSHSAREVFRLVAEAQLDAGAGDKGEAGGAGRR